MTVLNGLKGHGGAGRAMSGAEVCARPSESNTAAEVNIFFFFINAIARPPDKLQRSTQRHSTEHSKFSFVVYNLYMILNGFYTKNDS